MKKKPIIFILGLLLLGLAYWYFKYVYGRRELHKNTDTPKEFLSRTVIKKEDYANDSIELISQLRTLLIRHEKFFNNKAYFDSTELIIDSITYSPDLKKLAVFVITKNPTYRQLMPDAKYSWYYDATCYLGVRQNNRIALSWIGPVFTNSYSLQNISHDIREAGFRTFATKDTSRVYAYNFNDKRFWDSPIWKKIEEDELKKKEFEEEKKNHPENVYEPKH